MKSLMYYIPAHILVLYGAGVLFQFHIDVQFNELLLFFFICISLVLYRIRCHKKYAFCTVFFCIGMLSVGLRKVEQVKVNLGDNSIQSYIVTKVLKENDFNRSYYAFLEEGKVSFIKEKVLLKIQKDSLEDELHIGDRVVSRVQPIELKSQKNPYAFDYKHYLLQKNIAREVYLEKGNWMVSESKKRSLKAFSEEVRKKLILNLQKKIVHKDVLSVTLALILGERKGISTLLQQDYSNAGVVHILAVSGLHIGIIVMLLQFLFYPLKRFKYGKESQLFLILFLLWCYAFLAGLSSSVVRSVTMFSFVVVGLALKRRTPIYHSLVTSALVLVLVNPFYFFDLGFRMSYIAVFAIVTLFPIFSNIWKPKNRIFKYIYGVLLVSLAAQIGLLPITLFYFNQFPGLFLVSNLVILPTLGVVLIFGFCVLVLSCFDADMYWFFRLYENIVLCLNRYISFIGNQEAWLIKNISFSLVMMISIFLIVIALVRLLKGYRLKNLYIVGLSILFFQVVLFYEFFERRNNSNFVVFDTYKTSLITILANENIDVYGEHRSGKYNAVQNMRLKTGAKIRSSSTSIPNFLKFENQTIFVIDSFGIYKGLNVQIDILLLRNSPKINLDRCLQQLHPEIIIMDGSNYKYLKKRWIRTCIELNLPYHNTSALGAYVLSSESKFSDLLLPNRNMRKPQVKNMSKE